MEKKKSNLPLGIHTFEDLRTRGDVYVDKTKYLVELINTGKVYSLPVRAVLASHLPFQLLKPCSRAGSICLRAFMRKNL